MLVAGDLQMGGTGTVTHIDGDRVYAFGHPFYNLGPTQFPMKKAYIYSVFPSLQQSWKIAASLDAVGWSLVLCDKPTEALSSLENAVKTQPDSPRK
jgi:hypothetical protein